MRAAGIVRTAKDVACWGGLLVVWFAANGNRTAQGVLVLGALSAILVISLTMRT